MIFKLRKQKKEELTNEDVRQIMRMNQGVVRDVAEKYNEVCFMHFWDYYDLLQAGNIGLYRAIRKYNPSTLLGPTFDELCQQQVQAEIAKCMEK